MILDITTFKKMVKAAADGHGLTIVNTGREIHFLGGYWIINIDRDRLHNKALAAVIELCGELPKEGEAFTVNKFGDKQMEMDLGHTGVGKIVNGRPMKMTRVIVDGYRAFQDDEGTITLIREIFVNLISAKNIDQDESLPNPVKQDRNPSIHWQNQYCTVVACPMLIDEDSWKLELLEALRTVELE